MPDLKVKGLEQREWGAMRVRLHKTHRNGIPRYGIAKIVNTANSKHVVAILLGHEDAGSVYLDYDARDSLDVAKGQKLQFTVSSTSLLRRLWWYLTINDPIIRIPAWLAVWSVVLGIAGIGLGLASILYT